MKVIDVVHQDPQECNADWVYISVPGHSLVKKYKRFSATNWELGSPNIPIFISDELLEEAYQVYLKEKEPSMEVTDVVYIGEGSLGWNHLWVEVKIGDNYFVYRRYSAEGWHTQGKSVMAEDVYKLEEAYQTYSKKQEHIKEKAIMKDTKQTSNEKDAIALIDATLKLTSILRSVEEVANVHNIPMPELSDIECRHVAVSCPFSFETIRGWFPVKNDWVGLCGHMEDTDKWYINEDSDNKSDEPLFVNKSDEPTITIVCWGMNGNPKPFTKLDEGMKTGMTDDFITPMTKVFGEPAWILNSTHLPTLDGMDAAIQPFTANISLYRKLIGILENTVSGDIIVSYY